MVVKIDKLLKLAVDKGASDLHIRVPSRPVLRIDGVLHVQESLAAMTPKDIEFAFESITTTDQRKTFYGEMELDFAYSVTKLARFRVSALKQRGSISLAFRRVPFHIQSIDDLGLPQICKDLLLKPRGLILVTGPTGSGKTTTMAAMIDHLNEYTWKNIITIEDPIEHLDNNKNCRIGQRDPGDDTKARPVALKHALRHDPDVIVVGEMRDLETVATAIAAAETGHLVLGTLHTTDASQTVDRIIDIFPPSQQQQIRLQLSQVFEAVLSQTLLPRLKGGRIAAFEILLANPAVRNLIREHKTFELNNIMQLNSKDGMQNLDQALTELVRDNIISQEEAMAKSSNPERLTKMLQFQFSAQAF